MMVLMVTMAGRSLRSCQSTFQTLRSVQPHASPGALTQPPHSHQTHAGRPDSTISKKRSLPFKDPSTPANRALQPRPSATLASLNGEQGAAMQPSAGDGPAEPPRKKRGRPSKAEMEARAQAAAARGEVYPPVKTPRTPKSATKPTPRRSIGGQEDLADFSGGVIPMDVVTPQSGPGASGAGSVGKKRRGRPTKAEAIAKRFLLERAAAAQAANENHVMDPQDDGLDDEVTVATLMEGTQDEVDDADEHDVHMAASLEIESSATL